MKSYRSRFTFVTLDVLFHDLLPFLKKIVFHTFLSSAWRATHQVWKIKFEFVGVGGRPVLLKQYSQYACLNQSERLLVQIAFGLPRMHSPNIKSSLSYSAYWAGYSNDTKVNDPVTLTIKLKIAFSDCCLLGHIFSQKKKSCSKHTLFCCVILLAACLSCENCYI